MTAFWWFSEDFRPLSEDFLKLFRRPDERSRTFSENFAKIFEDVRRLPKTFGEDPKMFRWYTNEFKYNLRDKLDISEIIDIFTCEDIISSHKRISHRFYVTTRYTTDFYIIKRTLHVSAKIWILCSRGKNNISLVRCAHSWDIVLATRT